MRKIFITLWIVVLIGIQACQSVSPEEIEATVNAAVAATQSAQPTATFTQTPTYTVTSSPTHIPSATLTETPHPTDTLIPTATSPSLTITHLENGGTYYVFYEHGFSILLPENWYYLDGKDETIEAILENTEGDDESTRESIETFQLQLQFFNTIKFLAIEIPKDGVLQDIPTNLNVQILELPVTISLDTMVDAVIEQLESRYELLEPIQHEIIFLGSQEIETLRLIYKISSPSEGSALEVYTQQYIILIENKQFVLTFTTPLNSKDTSSAMFDEIANSFELTPLSP